MYIILGIITSIILIAIYLLHKKITNIEDSNMIITPNWMSSKKRERKFFKLKSYLYKIRLLFNKNRAIKAKSLDKKLKDFITVKSISTINREIVKNMELSGKFYVEIPIVYTDIYKETALPKFLERKFVPYMVDSVPYVKKIYENEGYIVDIIIKPDSVTYTIINKL